MCSILRRCDFAADAVLGALPKQPTEPLGNDEAIFGAWVRAMELDPLIMLLDFLVGDSVEMLARKNRLPNEYVEQALRTALASYGFRADRDLAADLPST